MGCPSEENWPGYSELPNVGKIKWKAQGPSKLRKSFPTNSQLYAGSSLTAQGFDLLEKLLSLDPKQCVHILLDLVSFLSLTTSVNVVCRRITAEDALDHEYFNESPPPKVLSFCGLLFQVCKRLTLL
jgi:cell division cycle 2-like protein